MGIFERLRRFLSVADDHERLADEHLDLRDLVAGMAPLAERVEEALARAEVALSKLEAAAPELEVLARERANLHAHHWMHTAETPAGDRTRALYQCRDCAKLAYFFSRPE